MGTSCSLGGHPVAVTSRFILLKVKRWRKAMGMFLRKSGKQICYNLLSMAEEEIALSKHQEILKSSFIIILTVITIT